MDLSSLIGLNKKEKKDEFPSIQRKSDGDPNILITSANIKEEKKKDLLEVSHVPVYLLEQNLLGSVPMDEDFVVKFERVKNNILNALNFLQSTQNVTNSKKMDKENIKKRVESWRNKLASDYNKNIITDGFWLIILYKNESKFAKSARFKAIENAILDRIACNLVEFMMSAKGKDNDLFFQVRH